MGKIREWFFGRENDTLGHTNSRTKKNDPRSLTMPPRNEKGQFVSQDKKE